MPNATCSIDGCEKPVHARGWCRNHYMNWHRCGNPRGTRLTLDEKMTLLIDKDRSDGCWLWRGKCLASGYGYLSVEGQTTFAHRVSYEYHVGPIPEGLHIDHLCRVRNCVNPEHLEPVTHKENHRRGMRATASGSNAIPCG